MEIDRRSPEIGIILGSGLGTLVDTVSNKTIIPYAKIPHFPQSTITFHEGNALIGEWAKKTVFIMQGRFHYYEGQSPVLLTLPIRIMYRQGVRILIITNSSGSLRDEIKAGSLTVIHDHINLMGINPLIGPYEASLGERFPDLSDAYDRELMNLVSNNTREEEILKVVYAAIAGPSLPTGVEIKMLRILGADIVGMSTVPEVLVARQLGIKVLALSVITDQATPLKMERPLPQQVKKMTLKNKKRLQKVISTVINQLSR